LVDRRLEAIATDEARALRGKVAVAQAKLAYRLFRERFSGERWEKLAARGARLQRPLWASTSTKNPEYPDTLYVDNLIGPDTVNTLPEQTIEAFEDHGTLARTVDEGVDEAEEVFERVAALGIDLEEVGLVLEEEGVAAAPLDDTFFLVSSKSGTTLEVECLLAHCWKHVPDGSRYAAITDPGTPLASLGEERGFRRVFLNQPDIGGRYSVLSYFGMVP